jgi:hypothetical protein
MTRGQHHRGSICITSEALNPERGARARRITNARALTLLFFELFFELFFVVSFVVSFVVFFVLFFVDWTFRFFAALELVC